MIYRLKWRGDEQIADLLAEHFSTAFTNESLLQEEALNFTAPPYPDDAPELDQPFFVEVAKALLGLDVNEGSGSDSSSASFFKRAASVLAQPLTIIYNAFLARGVSSIAWKIAHMVAVYKSPLRSKIKNYSIISL